MKPRFKRCEYSHILMFLNRHVTEIAIKTFLSCDSTNVLESADFTVLQRKGKPGDCGSPVHRKNHKSIFIE